MLTSDGGCPIRKIITFLRTLIDTILIKKEELFLTLLTPIHRMTCLTFLWTGQTHLSLLVEVATVAGHACLVKKIVILVT